MRCGFTIIGPLGRPAGIVARPLRVRSRLSAAPNPFIREVRLRGGTGDVLTIVDLTGRTWFQASIGPSGGVTWDAGAGARRAPPGIYLVRSAAGRGAGPIRIGRPE